jgi:hypothetical protein
LLIIGFGWLLAYAFQNDWIGPGGQITIGILLSMIFVVLGYWKLKDSVSQGGSFLVVGSTGIILTVFAAQNVYNMFNPAVALAGIFIASLFVTVASLLYKSKNLAVIGLILSSIAPIMVHMGTNHVALYSYLTVVVLSSIWVVFITGWREMTLASLVIVSLYSLSSTSVAHSSVENLILAINYFLVIVFYCANIASLIRYKEDSPASDLFSAGINSFYFLGWTMLIVPKEWQVMVIIGAALIFAVGSFIVYYTTGRKEAFGVYAGAGAMLLGVATAIQLQNRVDLMAIAFILEISVITILAYLMSKTGELVKYVVWLYIIPGLMSLMYMSSYEWSSLSRTGTLPKAFFVLSLLGSALFFIGLFVWYRNKTTDNQKDEAVVGGVMITIGSVYAYIVIWLVTHGMMGGTGQDTATFVSMAIYTIVGLISYVVGKINDNKAVTAYGSVLMIFVTGRLLLVDIWHMASIVSRFITFFGVGALFMSTAFLVKGKQTK